MTVLSAIVAFVKALAAALGLIRQESELAAGRDEQRSADLAAREKAEAEARKVEADAVKKHASDTSDAAFDQDFKRTD